MRKREEVALFGNLTAMIDVVFQIIIFFVCTANMQDSALDTRIRLAMAPNGKPVGAKDPRTIWVDVSERGVMSIARTQVTKSELSNIVRKAVIDCGDDVPVVIRGDSKSTHNMIRAAMDTCAEAGVWKIKIAAMKEKGGNKAKME